MAKSHPLDAAFAEAKGTQVISIPVPWTPAEGLCVGDLFGGNPPLEVRLPEGLTEFPPLRFTRKRDEALFLGQRFSDAAVVKWEPVEFAGIDRSAICVFPRSRKTVSEGVEEQLDTKRGWSELTDEGSKLLAVYVVDDGNPELFFGLDENGACIAWVLNLGDVEIPWKPDASLVPPALAGFIKPQLKYGVVGRVLPMLKPFELAKSLRLPRRHSAMGHQWFGASFGNVKVVDVTPTDFHFYARELELLGMPSPASFFRVLFHSPNITSVPDAHWRAMLGVMARLTKDVQGVIYRIDGEQLLKVDFSQF